MLFYLSCGTEIEFTVIVLKLRILFSLFSKQKDGTRGWNVRIINRVRPW